MFYMPINHFTQLKFLGRFEIVLKERIYHNTYQIRSEQCKHLIKFDNSESDLSIISDFFSFLRIDAIISISVDCYVGVLTDSLYTIEAAVLREESFVFITDNMLYEMLKNEVMPVNFELELNNGFVIISLLDVED